MFDLDNTTHTVIEQSNAATNPYFAISKSKTALEMVFLSNCQKDTLAIIYNRCVLININTSAYDMEIKSG